MARSRSAFLDAPASLFARQAVRTGGRITKTVEEIRRRFSGVGRNAARRIFSQERDREQRRQALLSTNFGRFTNIRSLLRCPPDSPGITFSATIQVFNVRTGRFQDFTANANVDPGRRVIDVFSRGVQGIAMIARALGYEYRGPLTVPRDQLGTFNLNFIDCRPAR